MSRRNSNASAVSRVLFSASSLPEGYTVESSERGYDLFYNGAYVSSHSTRRYAANGASRHATERRR